MEYLMGIDKGDQGMDISLMSFSLLNDREKNLIDADTMVSVAAKNGFQKLDMMSHERKLYGEADLNEAMDKYEMHCDCVISHIPFFTENKETIESWLQEDLALAKSYNNKMIMVVPGINDEKEQKVIASLSRDEIMNKTILGYRLAVETAKKYGIKVGFENTPQCHKPLAAPEDCEYLLKNVPDLGFIFDTGNFRVANTACDELAIYEKLKKYIIRVHIKDVVVGTDFSSGEICTNGQKIRCVTTGSGIIPIKEIIHALIRDGYEGVLAVEYAAPASLHGNAHADNIAVYCDYIKGCMEGEPLQTRYGVIEGVSKPISRLFFGTSNPLMLMGKNVEYLLDAAMSYGINSFDCARGYGGAEKSLGQWIKARNNRDRVVILSKCGNIDETGQVCVNRKVMKDELAASLEALQTNYIDIYLLHRDDPQTPVSEFITTFNEMKKEGKIRVFGVSNWTHTRIEEANAYAEKHNLEGFRISSPNFGLAEQVQDPWGGECITITGNSNREARQWYRKNQMPLVSYSSLARGLMAGKIKSSEEEKAEQILDPFTVRGYVCHNNFVRLKRCEIMADKKGCTVAQLAVGWMFTQGINIYAAVATTNISRLRENIQALYVEISREEGEYLNQIED